MIKPTRKNVLIAVGLVILFTMLVITIRRQQQPRNVVSTPFLLTSPTPMGTSESLASPTAVAYKTINATDITNVPESYRYSVEIPSTWQVEIVKEAEAINFYDPSAAGDNNLDKSQLFIRYFTANDFETLTTVNVVSREPLTIQGRPAVRYIIEKKANVANFAHQPAWRNQKHTVTDIRVADTRPSIFYVVAKRPDLNDDIYQHFFDSIKLSSATTPAPTASGSVSRTSLAEPVDNFLARITKKKFGTYVTPQNSPVSPERFTGYHTGVDAEYADVSSDVNVRAIAPGTVVASRNVSGYGGVVVIRHSINGKSILTLYGHLDPKTLYANGTQVSKGDQIGTLGEGGTSETDGERKHLHLAMLKGTSVNYAGYVPSQSQLDSWYNPLDFF